MSKLSTLGWSGAAAAIASAGSCRGRALGAAGEVRCRIEAAATELRIPHLVWLHEVRLFRGVESHREYAGVAVVPDVAAEAVRSVTFYLGEREVERGRRK